MEIGVITNPNSRKNRNRPDRAERLQRIVGSLGEVHETSSVESIKPVLRDFLRKRARYWVADGGDGALHWMLRMGMEVLQEDEFVDQSLTLPMTLPTKGGTIDFVANNVGIQGDAEGILAMLRRGVEGGSIIEETEVDSMVIDGEQLDRRHAHAVPHLRLRVGRRRHRPALLLEVLRARGSEPAHDRQGRREHRRVGADRADAARALRASSATSTRSRRKSSRRRTARSRSTAWCCPARRSPACTSRRCRSTSATCCGSSARPISRA